MVRRRKIGGQRKRKRGMRCRKYYGVGCPKRCVSYTSRSGKLKCRSKPRKYGTKRRAKPNTPADAMKRAGKEWRALKKAGKLGNLKWKNFWKQYM